MSTGRRHAARSIRAAAAAALLLASVPIPLADAHGYVILVDVLNPRFHPARANLTFDFAATWTPGVQPIAIRIESPKGFVLFPENASADAIVASASSLAATGLPDCVSIPEALPCAQSAPPDATAAVEAGFGQPSVPGWIVVPDRSESPGTTGDALWLVRHRTRLTADVPWTSVGGSNGIPQAWIPDAKGVSFDERLLALNFTLVVHSVRGAAGLAENATLAWRAVAHGVKPIEPPVDPNEYLEATESKPVVIVDRTPPRMTVRYGAPVPSTGWFTSPVTVAVNATDAGVTASPPPHSHPGGDPGHEHVVPDVNATVIACTGDPCRTARSPLRFATEGVHAWRARGVDVAGNENLTRWTVPARVAIDLTPPAGTARLLGLMRASHPAGPFAPARSMPLDLSFTDAASGVDAWRAIVLDEYDLAVSESPWTKPSNATPASGGSTPAPADDGHDHSHGDAPQPPPEAAAGAGGPAVHLPDEDGRYGVVVEVRDRAGHVARVDLGRVALDRRAVAIGVADLLDPETGSTAVTDGRDVRLALGITTSAATLVHRWAAVEGVRTPPPDGSPLWRAGPPPTRVAPAEITLAERGPSLRQVFVFVETAAGVQSKAIARIVLDTEAPVADAFQLLDLDTRDPYFTNSLSVAVRATVPADLVAWSLSTSALAPGAWSAGASLPATVPLPAAAEGPVTVHLWLRDAAGHVNYAANATVVLDLTPPRAPVVALEDIDGACRGRASALADALASDGDHAHDTGDAHDHAPAPLPPVPEDCVAIPGRANDATVGLRVVRAAEDEGPVSYVVTDGDLTEDATWTPGLPATVVLTGGDGARTVRVFARDAAGNVNPVPAKATVDLDRTAPTTSADLPAGVAASPLVVRLNASERAATWWRVGGDEYRRSLPAVLTGDGALILEWFSEDDLGNREAVRRATVRLDAAPPRVEAVAFEAEASVAGAAVRVKALVTDANVVAVDGVVTGPLGEPIEMPMALGADGFRVGSFVPPVVGEYDVLVVARDALGREGSASAIHHLHVVATSDLLAGHSHDAPTGTAPPTRSPDPPAIEPPEFASADDARPTPAPAATAVASAFAAAAVALGGRRRRDL